MEKAIGKLYFTSLLTITHIIHIYKDAYIILMHLPHSLTGPQSQRESYQKKKKKPYREYFNSS